MKLPSRTSRIFGSGSKRPRRPGGSGDRVGRIEGIRAALRGDLPVWRDLAARGRLDPPVGLVLGPENAGPESAPRFPALGADRGVTLGLDIRPDGPAEAQPLAK